LKSRGALAKSGRKVEGAVHKMPRPARRVVVSVVGGILVVVGLLMVALPGPAFVVLPLGLAVMATEFQWARRLLRKVKEKFKSLRKKK
jgi:uncharacterized protein (TIGR02611 family)